jgi:hypothetical protein
MAFRAVDIPDSVPGKSELYPNSEEWINPGDSVVIEPGGRIAAGPMRREQGILYAEIDLERIGIAQRSLDVCCRALLKARHLSVTGEYKTAQARCIRDSQGVFEWLAFRCRSR